jgi:hypothetical protein
MYSMNTWMLAGLQEKEKFKMAYAQQPQSYASESAYDPQSAYYNPYALGNQGFYMPSGQQGGYGQSNVSTAIQGQGQGYQIGGTGTQYGTQAGQTGQNMQSQYFQSLYAPQQLMAQQNQYQQANIATAIANATSTMEGMGIPATGDLGSLETWAEQKSALESQTIKKNKQEAERTMEDQWARKGSALGSEHERNVAEIEGASLAAMRSSSIGAAIDAFMKRPQLLAQLIQSMKG